MRHARQSAEAVLAVGLPALSALALAGALAGGDPRAYAAPLAAAALAGAAWTVWQAALGRGWAISALLAFSVVALNVTFRVREPGEVGLDLQNGLKLAGWLVLGAVALVRFRTLLPLARDPVLALALAGASVALASAAWSPVPAYSGANAYGVFANFALAGLMATELGPRRAFRVMMASLTALIGLSLAGGVLVPDIAVMPPSVEETAFRLQGFSGHPNALGQQAAVFCLVAVGARWAGAIGRPWCLLGVGMGLAAAMAAKSRFSLTAFLVGFLFVLLRRRGLLRPALVVAAPLAALALAYLSVFPPPDLDDLFGGISRTGSAHEIMTLTGRTDLWAVALDKIAERPLLGYGFQGTENLLAEGLPRNFYGSAVNPHNMLLQSLLSVGIIGTLPWLAAFLLLAARAVARPDDFRDMVVVSVLVSGIGEIEIFGVPVLQNLVVYWVLALHAARALERKSAAPPEPPPAVAKLGLERIA